MADGLDIQREYDGPTPNARRSRDEHAVFCCTRPADALRDKGEARRAVPQAYLAPHASVAQGHGRVQGDARAATPHLSTDGQ